MTTPLVIAAHGTRDPQGEAECRRFAQRVQDKLDGVPVGLGFVELSQPPIPAALAHMLQEDPARRAVVMPLMLGTGAHARVDIPEFIEEALEEVPGAHVDYAAHLGPDPRLMTAVRQRVAAAMGEWERSETSFVFVGRGALVADANADHVRLARMFYEEDGWADVVPGFIQVTRPSLPEALDRAYAAGARQIVVMGHWLFPGRLRTWTFQQTEAWAAAHPDAQVRSAEPIGDCDELAEVVIDRYRESLFDGVGAPAYLSGLRLAGRRVVVVGGGAVSARRVPRLLDAGAEVTLIAPQVVPALAELAAAGRLTWLQRGYEPGDVTGAWYVLAQTDAPAVNAAVTAEAEAAQTFCVRADDAMGATAWTATTVNADGVSVGVLSSRNPLRSRGVRDSLLASIRSALAE